MLWSLSVRSRSAIIICRIKLRFVQTIYQQKVTAETREAIFNLFAACLHTMPLGELLESAERARRDAQLRYVVIYGAVALRRRPRNYHKVYLKMP